MTLNQAPEGGIGFSASSSQRSIHLQSFLLPQVQSTTTKVLSTNTSSWFASQLPSPSQDCVPIIGATGFVLSVGGAPQDSSR